MKNRQPFSMPMRLSLYKLCPKIIVVFHERHLSSFTPGWNAPEMLIYIYKTVMSKIATVMSDQSNVINVTILL